MIYKITQKLGVIPHFENIIEIHQENKFLKKLDVINPCYAGGYPMSLLFAPRIKGEPLKIQHNFYSDYDLYFEDEEKLNFAIEKLDNNLIESDIQDIIDTENARTYIYESKDIFTNENLTLQVVKKITNNISDILETFDFLNCAIAYNANKKMFYMHKDAFLKHSVRELEILQPWMLENVNEETIQNVIIQVARFKKYCMRWEYTLSDKSFDKLIEVYYKYPNLKTSKGITYRTTGGAYAGMDFIATQNQNIWSAILPILKIHPKWGSFKDPHQILKVNDEDSITEDSKSKWQDKENILTNDTIPF